MIDPGDDVLFQAVSLQMREGGWSRRVDAGTWDNPSRLEEKAAALAELKAWIGAIENKPLRKAYVRWWEMVDYTLRRYRDEAAIQVEATNRQPTLPALPKIPNGHPQ